ncbi:MAG: hypothetical protein AB3N33_04355, partial [Puniceicoccaceae bacterium]
SELAGVDVFPEDSGRESVVVFIFAQVFKSGFLGSGYSAGTNKERPASDDDGDDELGHYEGKSDRRPVFHND